MSSLSDQSTAAMADVAPRGREPFLEIASVTKTFPGVQALQNVSLSAFPGEVHALVGENGAGKSTLLKTVFGVYEPDAGELRVRGEAMRFGKPSDALRSGIAMVHQELSLVPQMSAVQNIVLGQELTRLGVIDWSEARTRARRKLATLGFRARADVPVRRLSVAQQQLVELARALAIDARLIILDEPTASLTTQESEQLFRVIRELRAAGRALIYVSHRLKEVLELADRITVLRDGHVVGAAPRAEFGGEDDLVQLMVGRNLEAIGIAGGRRPPGAEALRVEGVSLPGVLHDVSFALRRGEIVALAGMVGAGRTELARSIFGAERRARGRILIHGRPTVIRSPRDAIKSGIALLPEDRKGQGLVLGMSTASNATLLEPPSTRGVLDRSRQRGIAQAALARLGARVNVGAPVRHLSGGTQQKVVLARWLLRQGEIFIFDEPTRGIDVGAKGEIHALMRRLADDGKAVLMISSDLPEVLGMADRVLVMRAGRIVAELDKSQASEEEIVRHAAAA